MNYCDYYYQTPFANRFSIGELTTTNFKTEKKQKSQNPILTTLVTIVIAKNNLLLKSENQLPTKN